VAFDLNMSPDVIQDDFIDALESIIDVLKNYDSDHIIPTYGFGIEDPKNSSSSGDQKLFALNSEKEDCNLSSLEEIIESFETQIPNIKFNKRGSQFSPVL